MDMALAVGSFLLAFAIRFGEGRFDLEAIRSDPALQPYLSLVVFVPFIRAFTYSILGLYSGRPRSVSFGDVFDLFKAISLGTGIIVIVSFLNRGFSPNPGFSFSRFVFFLDWLVNIGAMAGAHTLIWSIRDEMRRRGFGLRSIVVQGTGETAQTLLAELDTMPELGYRVCGFIADRFDGESLEAEGRRFAYLGATENMLEVINEHNLDEVVVTNVGNLGADFPEFVNVCHKLGVVVRLAPDFYGLLIQGHQIEELGGQPAIQINEIGIVGWARVVKRAEDVVVSTAALVVSLPIMLATALLIRLESPGPALFRQRRVGTNGRHFSMYKFRSMYADAEARREELLAQNEADGMLFKIKSDPRITKVGRFIRSTSIDELPQLYNVLKGDMSIVGPRPLPASDLDAKDAWDHIRQSVPPGITGMWQVNRKAHTTEEMLKWDIAYIENWSLWSDIAIMLKTAFILLAGRKKNY